jgi:hypothetical protein
MSCERTQPNLTVKQRRQYHALIRQLAARMVIRNRQRKLSQESHSHVADVQVSGTQPTPPPPRRTERSALTARPVPADALRNLLRQAERQTSDVFGPPRLSWRL